MAARVALTKPRRSKGHSCGARRHSPTRKCPDRAAIALVRRLNYAADMKHILVALVLPLLPQTAHADDADAKRADAQKKIDDGKLKGCESLRTMLVGNKSCPDQAKAAAAMTCSVAAYNDMAHLQHQCADVLKVKADAMKKDSKTPPPSTAPAATGRCTITKVAGHDVSIDIPIKSKLFPDTDCKTHVRAAAEKWLAANATCEPKKTVFPYSFTFGTTVFNQTGYCPIPKKS